MFSSADRARQNPWLRTFITFSRTGYVTERIEACEEHWGTRYLGNPAAVDAIRSAPEYPAYARELRNLLEYPLTLYRVCPEATFERWRRTGFGKPVATSLSLPITEAFWELQRHRGNMLLLEVSLNDPEALIMRGRPKGCELVIDSGRVDPAAVRPRPTPSRDQPAQP